MKNRLLTLTCVGIAATTAYFIYAAQPFGGLQNRPITEGAANLLQDKAGTIDATATVTGVVVGTSGLVVGSGNTAVLKVLTAATTLNFASIAANTSADLTITVTGATTNGVVILGTDGTTLETGITLSGRVSSADTVSVRAANVTTGAIDPAARGVRATVIEY
jgi:hypothetical protein